MREEKVKMIIGNGERRNNSQFQKGQALTVLLVFMVIAITITTGTVAVIIVNTQNSAKSEQGAMALSIAESGLEDSLMRTLRDPNFSAETLLVNGGTASISVTGSTNKIFTSVGIIGSFRRTVQVTTSYNNNILTVLSWKEI